MEEIRNSADDERGNSDGGGGKVSVRCTVNGEAVTLYAEKEGAVLVSRMHPMLLELASDDGRATITREVSDAYVARASGLPALRITGESSDPDEPAEAALGR